MGRHHVTQSQGHNVILVTSQVLVIVTTCDKVDMTGIT